MKSVFFNSEVLDAEKKIIGFLGIPSIVLMENAGSNSADFISNLISTEKYRNIVILAGKGNNAGDGFVIARHLANKKICSDVFLFYPESDLKGDALLNFNVIKNLYDKINILSSDSFDSYLKENTSSKILFVDSVFGIGFKGELDDNLKTAFKKINSNKYSNGKLFALCGSTGFSGAAYLSSLSALRIGCGAVILGVPKSLNRIMESKTTEVITNPLPETDEHTFSLTAFDKIMEKIKWSDAVLIGPGIGRNEETLSLVRKILSVCTKPVILDADGIFAFKGNQDLLKNRNCDLIITPHYGEFSNLTGIKTEEIKNNIYAVAMNFAREYNLILVLKNSPTVITDGSKFYINQVGRENLATVGSGDVLSGVIAGILTLKRESFSASLAGVYIHSRSGDILYEKTGSDSTIASDLIEELQNVKKELRSV